MSTETEVIEQNVTQPAEEVVTQSQAEVPPWEQKTTETPATQEQSKEATTPNEQEEQRKVRGGFQRRIDELVREREHERAEKQKLLDVLAKQAGQQPQPQQPAGESKTEQAPTLEQFDSYEKYLAAHARWEAKAVFEEQRKADQARAEKEQAEAKQRETVEQQKRRVAEQSATLNKLTVEAEKKYPDFAEKVFDYSGDLPISETIIEVALEAGATGMDVLYHLGTHHEEAQRIAKLSPAAQAREFGKLEVSLSKQTSGAPAPISPVAGKKASTDLPSSSDDMGSWIAKRNRQLGRK